MQYILVHGAWQGSWCWEPLSKILNGYGHQVSCPDLPGHGKNTFPLIDVSYEIYYKSLIQEIQRYDQPVILVAHSMSGILAAPLLEQYPEKISHLFLIAAFVAQNGQSLLDVALAGGPSEIPDLLTYNEVNHTQQLDLSKVKSALYHDCPSELADWAINQLQPQPVAPLTEAINWIDSLKTRHQRTYLFCEDDRDVHPSTQLQIIQHYPCEVVQLQSGHFPFLSQTKKLAEILKQKGEILC